MTLNLYAIRCDTCGRTTDPAEDIGTLKKAEIGTGRFFKAGPNKHLCGECLGKVKASRPPEELVIRFPSADAAPSSVPSLYRNVGGYRPGG